MEEQVNIKVNPAPLGENTDEIFVLGLDANGKMVRTGTSITVLQNMGMYVEFETWLDDMIALCDEYIERPYQDGDV